MLLDTTLNKNTRRFAEKKYRLIDEDFMWYQIAAGRFQRMVDFNKLFSTEGIS